VIITDIQTQKKNSSRFNLDIDGKFFCGISADTLTKYALYQGKVISPEELEEVLDTELQTRFFNRVLEYLTRAPKTEFQIQRYMKDLVYKKKGKWFEELSKEKQEKIFVFVTSKLKEYGYIDDRSFAETFVNSRIRNKPRGKNILISELISKGVNKEIATETVNDLVEDEMDMLKKIYTKKYGDEQLDITQKKKIDFLLRKGFNWDLIQEYMNNDTRK
jgi:regulatory protein